MKKLMSAILVGLLANVAMAGAGFDILGTDPIEVPEVGTVDVYIATTGGASGGMSLAMQAFGGFDIVGLEGADFAGAYWTTTTGGTASYKTDPMFAHPGEIAAGSAYAIVDVGSSAGNITLPAGAMMAKVTISAGGLGLGSTGLLTTDADIQQSSLAAGTTAQDSIGLVVTPEPMTALLLLGCMPLIRRRRA
jgi:hypothetical protein